MIDPIAAPQGLPPGPPGLAPQGLPPLLNEGAPPFDASNGDLDVLPPPAPPDLSTDPAAIPVDDVVNRVRLNPERKERLLRRMLDLVQAFDASMTERRQREQQITKAYNQIPDADHAGQQPNASRLVSEITRVHTTTAEARISGSLRSIKPFIACTVVGPQVPTGEDIELFMKIATAIEHFMVGYFGDMGCERLWPHDIRRSARVGTSIKRILWEEKHRVRRYRDKGNKLQEIRSDIGHIKWRLIDNENFIAWPLHEPDIQELQIAGHRSWMPEAAFVAWARSIGLPAEDAAKVVAFSRAGGDPKPPEEAERLKDHDIKLTEPSESPYRGQVMTTELWINLPLDDDDTNKDPRYRILFHEGTRVLFLVEHNPHWSGQHPYWKTPYLEEDGSFWASGVGHEVLFEQAAGSALRNLLIDNLKTIAHHVRVFKLNTQAMGHMGSVSPGYEFATEDPETDFRTVKLGEGLEDIYQALADNDARASRNSGVTELLMGRGDPVMKTRAAAGAYSQLIAESGKKFGGIDSTIRTEYSRMLMSCLHLLAQYGTPELFASILSQEEASLMARIKEMPFVGLLDRVFKLEMKAPSAGSNEESLKQNLLVIYNLAVQHVQVLMPLAQMVMGAVNPAGFMELQKGLLTTLNDLFARIVAIHETGVGAPDIGDDPAPLEMVVNQLFLQLQEMEMLVAQSQAVSPPPGGVAGPGAPGGPPPPTGGAPGPAAMGGPPMGPM